MTSLTGSKVWSKSPVSLKSSLIREWLKTLVIAVFLVWIVWVTNHLLRQPKSEIVKLNLAGLVQEYMVAASHSNWTEPQIKSQTEVFTTAIDDQISQLSGEGKTVLMTEAVLSKSVPDVTPQVRALILKKVAWPTSAVQGPIAPLVPHGAPIPGAPAVPQNAAPAQNGGVLDVTR